MSSSGPYEFIYGNALNTATAGPVQVSLAPTPDLVVTNVAAPTTANEGDAIEVTWTVKDRGAAAAAGPWTDTIFMRVPGASGPGTPAPITLASFTYAAGLDAGKQYTRTETVHLPAHTQGTWQIGVITDASDAVYEGSPRPADSTTYDASTLQMSLLPRPDLQVETVSGPTQVLAGGAAGVSFVIVNRGSATTSSHWVDQVFLGLHDTPSSGDILLATLDNGAALDPGQAYSSEYNERRHP